MYLYYNFDQMVKYLWSVELLVARERFRYLVRKGVLPSTRYWHDKNNKIIYVNEYHERGNIAFTVDQVNEIIRYFNTHPEDCLDYDHLQLEQKKYLLEIGRLI